MSRLAPLQQLPQLPMASVLRRKPWLLSIHRTTEGSPDISMAARSTLLGNIYSRSRSDSIIIARHGRGTETYLCNEQHKARVKETIAKDMEDMEKALYERKRLGGKYSHQKRVSR